MHCQIKLIFKAPVIGPFMGESTMYGGLPAREKQESFPSHYVIIIWVLDGTFWRGAMGQWPYCCISTSQEGSLSLEIGQFAYVLFSYKILETEIKSNYRKSLI